MKLLPVFLLLSVHIASAALGKSGLLSYKNNTKFDAIPFASHVKQSYTFCMLKCLEEDACIACNYNRDSEQCDLLKRISGIISIGKGYISGVLYQGKSVTVDIFTQ